jgi:hypothetical protein
VAVPVMRQALSSLTNRVTGGAPRESKNSAARRLVESQFSRKQALTRWSDLLENLKLMFRVSNFDSTGTIRIAL